MVRGRPAQQGRRQEILDATLSVIARDGISAATYRNIAQESGIPSGSLTFYFASREDLVFTAFESFVEREFEHQVSQFLDDSMPVLDRLVAAACGSQSASSYRILLAELYVLSYRDQRYAELTREWMNRARDVLEPLVPAGKARLVDAVVEGITLQHYFEPNQFSETDVRGALAAILDCQAL